MSTITQERPLTVTMNFNHTDWDSADLIIDMMKTEGYQHVKLPDDPEADLYHNKFFFVKVGKPQKKITEKIPDFKVRFTISNENMLRWLFGSSVSWYGGLGTTFNYEIKSNNSWLNTWLDFKLKKVYRTYSNFTVTGTPENVETFKRNLARVLSGMKK
jgi:hypothetical protein